MRQRTAQAHWQGNLREGSGTMRFGSGGAFEGKYSFASRMANDPGTNPEELIGAAEAGCFSMAFANELSKAGHRLRSGGKDLTEEAASRPPLTNVGRCSSLLS